MKNVFQILFLSCVAAMAVGCGGETAIAASNDQVKEPVLQAGGYSNINNATLVKMQKEGVILIDIRLPEEWRQLGVVEGSHKITFFSGNGSINPDFVPAFSKLVKPAQKVALICRTGNRTRAASQAIAQQLGYKNVYNVERGITSWIAEGRPVVK